MAITAFTATEVGDNGYRLDWASDLPTPTFYLYADGELLATTTNTSLTVGGTIAATFEVLDTAAAPTAVYPGFLTLAWYAANDAARYRVEQYDGASWNELATIEADERTYYTFQTPTLADDTEHTFRVVPVSSVENDGTPAVFVALVVRNPDPPLVDYVYDPNDGTVTISVSG